MRIEAFAGALERRVQLPDQNGSRKEMVPRDGIELPLRRLILKVYFHLHFPVYPSMYPALNSHAKAVWGGKQRIHAWVTSR